MRRMLAAAWVIARRDYVATVLSKSFLLFLIGPLFPLLIGLGFGAIGAADDRPPARPVLVVIADGAEGTALRTAAARLQGALGEAHMPVVRIERPAGPLWQQTRAVLGVPKGGASVVMGGGLTHPALFGTQAALDDLAGPTTLLLATARDRLALGAAAPPAVAPTRHAVIRAHAVDRDGRRDIARGGQFVLMLLTIMLSGMLISNLVEEKSSKVIEVLIAAVPVDAIFAGKLAAMLAMSLTGIAVWVTTGAMAAGLLLPAGRLGAMAPAVGWPAFVALGTLYFAMSYLLIGGLLLGIGAQAGSPREVQTLSMPLTMGQVLLFGFAAVGIGRPDSGIAIAAAAFPWSSPFAMLARAAERGSLWPHPIALGWQALWLVLVIRLAARRFRRHVLQSGGPARRWWRRVSD